MTYFTEQSLAANYQPYLPAPIGLWPLSAATGPADITTNKIPGNESWIAYDPLSTPGVNFINILRTASACEDPKSPQKILMA